MSTRASLRGDLLARLLLIQHITTLLPEQEPLLEVACRGLEEFPGVSSVKHSPEVDPVRQDGSRLVFPIRHGLSAFGALVVEMSNHEAIRPYIPYLQNTISVIAVILENQARGSQMTLERNQFFQHSRDMLCIAGGDGYFKSLNPRWQETLGWTIEELLSKPFVDFVHPHDIEATVAELNQHRAGEQVVSFQNRYRCRDGSFRWLEWNSNAVGDIFFATARDITEHHRAQDVLRRETEVAWLVQRITMLSNEASSMKEAYQICLDQVCEYTGWPVAHVYVRSPETEARLVSGKIWHLDQPHRFGSFVEITETTDFDAGKGLPGRVLKSRQRAWIADVTRDPNFPRAKLAKDIGVKGAFAFPVISKQVVVAVFEFFSEAAISADDLMLTTLADICASLGPVIERKQAEEALKASEKRFRDLAEGSLQGIVVLDNNGKPLFANPAVASMFGMNGPEELLALKSLDTVLAPHERARVKGYRKARLTGEPAPIEYVIEGVSKDGSAIWLHNVVRGVEWEGVPAAQSTLIDITKRKQAEEALRASEAKYRELTEGSLQAIVIADAKGKPLFVNQAAAAVFGYRDPKDLCRIKSNADLIAPQSRDQLIALRTSLISGEPAGGARTVEGLRKDGTRVWLEHSARTVEWEGQPAIQSVLVDITERKLAEDQLRQAQKMESVGQLTGGIAHDFNNLLAVVLGNLELAAGQLGAEDEKARGFVAAAVHGAERGAELTHRLLAYSRMQVLRPKAINLNSRIEDMIDLLRRTLGENVEIETMLAGDLWRSVVDPGELENAVLNLAINARDAMPQGGKLTIETTNMPLDDDYLATQTDVSPGDYVTVAVSDSGTGMTPDVMTRALEPFFTTKTVGAGSGLGLSMVYGFAKQSNGQLTIYSEIGEGTTVKLYLPRSFDESDTQAAEPEPAKSADGQGETILVIEDDTDVRNLVVSQLIGLGYSVLDAKDGPAAMALLDSELDINLVLTDVMLPGGLSGPQAAAEIRDRHGAIPTMYMSGYTENTVVHQGKLDRGIILLQKPFTKSDLARKVRQALDLPTIMDTSPAHVKT